MRNHFHTFNICIQMPPLNARAPFFNLMGYCPISYAFFLRMEHPFPPAHLFYSVWAHSAAPVEMGRINHLSGFLLHHVFNLVPRTVMLLRRVFSDSTRSRYKEQNALVPGSTFWIFCHQVTIVYWIGNCRHGCTRIEMKT